MSITIPIDAAPEVIDAIALAFTKRLVKAKRKRKASGRNWKPAVGFN
jgi:hypothetical protein